MLEFPIFRVVEVSSVRVLKLSSVRVVEFSGFCVFAFSSFRVFEISSFQIIEFCLEVGRISARDLRWRISMLNKSIAQKVKAIPGMTLRKFLQEELAVPRASPII